MLFNSLFVLPLRDLLDRSNSLNSLSLSVLFECGFKVSGIFGSASFIPQAMSLIPFSNGAIIKQVSRLTLL